MSEYIERQKALDFISEVEPVICMPPNNKPTFTAVKDADMMAFLESIPAADVRPVVLCRDCKYNMANIPYIQDGININENWNACQLTELYDSVKPDDFCSHGVKREES